MRPRPTVWTQTVWHMTANRTSTGLMKISVMLFNDVVDFLVDSGAAYSVVSQRIADTYELPLLQAVAWTDPAGTRTSSPRARVPLHLGGRGGLEVVVNALIVPIPLTFGVSGFLGADVLRHYDITMEERLLRLSQRVKAR